MESRQWPLQRPLSVFAPSSSSSSSSSSLESSHCGHLSAVYPIPPLRGTQTVMAATAAAAADEESAGGDDVYQKRRPRQLRGWRVRVAMALLACGAVALVLGAVCADEYTVRRDYAPDALASSDTACYRDGVTFPVALLLLASGAVASIMACLLACR